MKFQEAARKARERIEGLAQFESTHLSPSEEREMLEALISDRPENQSLSVTSNCKACETGELLTKHVGGCVGERAVNAAIGRWARADGGLADNALVVIATDEAHASKRPELGPSILRILRTKERVRSSRRESSNVANETISRLHNEIDELRERFTRWPSVEQICDCMEDAGRNVSEEDARRVDRLFRGRLQVTDEDVEPVSG